MKTTIGVFEDRADAERTITDLLETGLADADISYLHAEPGEVEEGTGGAVASGAAGGAVTGGAIGAIAGLTVASGILPGLGTLFVAGPLAAALGLTGAVGTTAAGAATGAIAGGVVGGLVSFGVARSDAEKYEQHLKEGRVAVIAHSMLDVTEVFARNNAKDVREYTQ